MADISVNTACKELKIAQIAQLNQFFQPLVGRMLMSKNVNNDVSKDSPIFFKRGKALSIRWLEISGKPGNNPRALELFSRVEKISST